MIERKARIASAFSEAAERYEAAARVQAAVAERVAERVRGERGLADPDVLEIGCGTGLLTRRLLASIPGGRWVVSDLSERMLEACAGQMDDRRVRFHRMDGEHPDLAEASFDLVVSSLAFQWFGDLDAALARLARLLRPGGRLVFATLGTGSLAEWRAAHEALGLRCGLARYPAAGAVRAPAGGTFRLEEEVVTETHDDARAFVRSLKAIGAGTPASGHCPLAPGDMRRVLARLGARPAITWRVLHGRFQAAPASADAGVQAA